MANKKNFRWLEDDIDNTLVLKLYYNADGVTGFYGVFNVMDVLGTTGDELDIETANIDDLTNLLTLGIVRFVNVIDTSDILDIPFRKLNLLYEHGNVLGKSKDKKTLTLDSLDSFLVMDTSLKKDYLVMSSVVDDVSDDLKEVMKIAYEFGDYGMQEKFDALSKVNLINHRRLLTDGKRIK